MAQRIIGIDPGLNHTGWGIIEIDGPHRRFIAGGTIEPPKEHLAQRLHEIHQALFELCERYRPERAACEIAFVNRNPQSTMLLCQARGAALTAIGRFGLCVDEFEPSVVKKSIAGSGRATKENIQAAIALWLKLDDSLEKSPDMADALAIALCAAHHQSLAQLAAQVPQTGVSTYASARSHNQGKRARSQWTAFVSSKK